MVDAGWCVDPTRSKRRPGDLTQASLGQLTRTRWVRFGKVGALHKSQYFPASKVQTRFRRWVRLGSFPHLHVPTLHVRDTRFSFSPIGFECQRAGDPTHPRQNAGHSGRRQAPPRAIRGRAARGSGHRAVRGVTYHLQPQPVPVHASAAAVRVPLCRASRSNFSFGARGRPQARSQAAACRRRAPC